MEWIKLTSYYRLYSHEKFRSTIAGLQTEIGDFFYRLMFGELIVSARRQQTVAWLRYRISKRVSIRVTIINNDYCSPACSHTALTFILNSSAGPRREREREREREKVIFIFYKVLNIKGSQMISSDWPARREHQMFPSFFFSLKLFDNKQLNN